MRVVVALPARTGRPRDYLVTGRDVIAARGCAGNLAARRGAIELARVRLGPCGDALLLATDREGGAIAWQVLEQLRERSAPEGKTIRRVVVFREIAPVTLRPSDAARDRPPGGIPPPGAAVEQGTRGLCANAATRVPE